MGHCVSSFGVAVVSLNFLVGRCEETFTLRVFFHRSVRFVISFLFTENMVTIKQKPTSSCSSDKIIDYKSTQYWHFKNALNSKKCRPHHNNWIIILKNLELLPNGVHQCCRPCWWSIVCLLLGSNSSATNQRQQNHHASNTESERH